MTTCKPQHRDVMHRDLCIAFSLVLAMAAVLLPKPAFAELLSTSASSDTRFAEVESPEQLKGAPAGAIPDAKGQTNNGVAKSSPSSLRSLDGDANYRALIEKEAAGTGLAPEIAEAVMAVESGYNPAAIGSVGEIGLMQILPSTARMLGFVGSNTDLAVPATNIRYGVTYLAQAWRLAGAELCTAVMKYRAGHGESRFSYLSVSYCLAVRRKLAARGFRITGTVPVATFGEVGSTGCKRKCVGGGRIGSVNLAVLNTRLGALVMQVRATR
jgi:soluble lytic murein transglycosylase-like protein